MPQNSQHGRHQKVRHGETILQIVATVEPIGERGQTRLCEFDSRWPAFFCPILLGMKQVDRREVLNVRFDRISAANIQAVTRARAFESDGIRTSERSAMCRRIAPLSNRTKSSSSYAGTCPNGCIARDLSDFWSSGPINHALYGNPASSSAHRTLRSRTKPRAKLEPNGKR